MHGCCWGRSRLRDMAFAENGILGCEWSCMCNMLQLGGIDW